MAIRDYKYKIEWCPKCKHGWITIEKDIATNSLYLLCEECDAEWIDPENIKPTTSTLWTFGRSVQPDFDDIKEMGWDKYIIEKEV